MADNDRNFDDVANHFANKIYGGLKGTLRLAVLWRDIDKILPQLSGNQVLDIGAGLGQISLRLAEEGYDCTLTDISKVMLDKAKASVSPSSPVQFLHASYQDLPDLLVGNYDLILCHAVLEWIEYPDKLFAVIDKLLADKGVLSLCFYNPVAPIYRNLLLGNFYHVNHPKPADNHSLTPNYPKDYDTVMHYLQDYEILTQSGIRVFYDYAIKKQGGLLVPDDVIALELQYSQQMPYWRMGRYLHIIAQKRPK